MDPSHLSEDFRDFLKCLNDAGVDYLLIGGHAVAFHGYVRPTTDMDIWIALDKSNAEKAVEAIRAFFGTPMEGLSPDWFLDPEQVSRFGSRPNMIEILTRIDGGDFGSAFGRRIEVEIDGVPTSVIALDDLKENKRASGRNKDLADLENLP
jgi:predicted nucleotidyltransferase